MLTKLDRKVAKPNNLEVLGHCLIDASHEIGNIHPYGNKNLIEINLIKRLIDLIKYNRKHLG